MLLGSAPGRMFHRIAAATLALGVSVLTLGGPASAADPSPSPSPSESTSPSPSPSPSPSASASPSPSPVAPSLEVPSFEAPPVEAPPVEAPPVEAPPVEAPPVEAPPVEAPPLDPAPPAPARPIITLGFEDGTADHFGVARILGQAGLRGVFYVNTGRLDNPKYLTLQQVRAMQRDGHEIGGHTVSHVPLSTQDKNEQMRAVCVDRNQLLAAGIRATAFAYPFADSGSRTGSLARACGYQNARATDGIGCAGCPDAETLGTTDRFRVRALSGFGSDTTARELKDAVNRTIDSDGWLQLAFRRICTTSCDGDSVRLTEFVKFVRWLAEQRDGGTVRTETVQQVLNGTVRPGVTPPRVTATAVTFQNNSFEQAGPAFGASPRCFAYTSRGSGETATWSRVTDSRRGRLALRAVVPPASAGARMVTAQDLGSCAPPIRANGHYRVGFWYKATTPITATTYARRPFGGYRAFGSKQVFPAAPTWSLASWTVGPTPDNGLALSMGVTMTAAGVYTFDDFAVAPIAERRRAYVAPKPRADREPAERRVPSKAAPVESTSPAAAFTPPPPDLNAALPDAEGQSAGDYLTGPPSWLGYSEIAGAILLAFAAVVVLDRRFRHMHRRTRFKIPRERRGAY